MVHVKTVVVNLRIISGLAKIKQRNIAFACFSHFREEFTASCVKTKTRRQTEKGNKLVVFCQ